VKAELCRFLRRRQQSNARGSSKTKNAMVPMTIPMMSPLVSFCFSPSEFSGSEEGGLVVDDVDELEVEGCEVCEI
jgi:hypothetical protein